MNWIVANDLVGWHNSIGKRLKLCPFYLVELGFAGTNTEMQLACLSPTQDMQQ